MIAVPVAPGATSKPPAGRAILRNPGAVMHDKA